MMQTKFILVMNLALLMLLTACDVGGGGSFVEGKEVPSVRTKTLADVGGDLSKITSYRYPDPRMYQFSLDDALKKGKPIVLEFATPGHCTQCDKQLQLLKEMLNVYGEDVIFLHMDQYFNPEAYDAFQVRGEPWTFVIDAQKKVKMVYPGRILYQELNPLLKDLTTGQKNNG
ncbi:MAG: thioredoxin [Mariprofundaceae bacterium]|nr:thioredoxin [Mariprofundaceae bacterium]